MKITRAALVLLCCQAVLIGIAKADEQYQMVEVVDPFLELHTGPGRGYPIFYVVERGELVEILKRRTDWFKVRTPRGKEGWVPRKQLERTLTAGGVQKSFRDALLEDYLKRHLELGIAGGIFDGEPVVAARAGYRFTDNLMMELSVGQVSGNFSSSLYYHANLVSMPFPEWRWFSPFFTIGIGRFNNDSRPTLVGDDDTDSTVGNAGAGVRAYITRNFIARFDFRDYLVLVNDDQNDEFQEYTFGVSFFF